MGPFPRAAALARKLLPIHKLSERLDYATACQDAPGEFVDLPIGRCHFIERGEGDPVLLIHGFLYHTIMWEPVAGTLSESFRTFTIDLMGWGYSERREDRDYDYRLYARQVLEFMDAKGLAKASIVGQSMGGGTAIRFACEHPDRVSKLVLVDPASLPNPVPLIGRIFALPLMGETLSVIGGDALRGANIKDLWFYRKELVTRDYVKAVTGPLRIKGSTWTLLNILRTLDFGSQTEQVNQLAELDIPTLIVWGREDKAVPLSCGQQMHRTWPKSELMVLDNAGHTPHEEYPELFLERVVPFLTGTGE